MLLQNPKKAIRELNREYFGRIGMHPKSRERLDESIVNEKSKSETQQRLFGMVYAYKQGELDLDDLDDDLAEKIKSIADDISMEDAKDFAETDHEDIPPEVKEELFRKKARAYIKEHLLAEENPYTGWENLPPGWDEESLQSFARSLTGKTKDDTEGFFSNCMDKMEDKLDEPEAFCASLKDEYLGREDWRTGPNGEND
jgi:hypothetical protein